MTKPSDGKDTISREQAVAALNEIRKAWFYPGWTHPLDAAIETIEQMPSIKSSDREDADDA